MPNHTTTSTTISAGLTLLLATACGLIVANIYYAQPLVGPIRLALGMSAESAGLIVTLTQIGYGIGLLFIVPLGDLIENRRLVLCLMGMGIFALLMAALSGQAWMFLASSLLIGLGSVAVQVLVPYAAHLAPEATRGQVVGNVMSGLMLGIMMARPVASFVTQISSWHVIFLLSAASMLVLGFVLWRILPARAPKNNLHYQDLMKSMLHLARTTPILQRRSLYQAFLFAAFSLFWTTVPLYLAGPAFHMSQAGIALFALAGVAGAVATPIAGRVADKGWIQPATIIAMAAVASAFLLIHLAPGSSVLDLALLVASAIVLDFGAAGNVTLSQRVIYSLGAEYRGRLNGIFMATFFMGGAFGSAIGGWAFARYGWQITTWIGFAMPVTAFLLFRTEKRYTRTT
ncbi:MFS transporter [Leeia oryzae]|uniref:MFS transporter n=1 Tax=Leeia oryzae TaxID=356662 RepID=UPI00036E098C|nr:MFS transporter [Leeia oryzae]